MQQGYGVLFVCKSHARTWQAIPPARRIGGSCRCRDHFASLGRSGRRPACTRWFALPRTRFETAALRLAGRSGRRPSAGILDVGRTKRQRRSGKAFLLHAARSFRACLAGSASLRSLVRPATRLSIRPTRRIGRRSRHQVQAGRLPNEANWAAEPPLDATGTVARRDGCIRGVQRIRRRCGDRGPVQERW